MNTNEGIEHKTRAKHDSDIEAVWSYEIVKCINLFGQIHQSNLLK